MSSRSKGRSRHTKGETSSGSRSRRRLEFVPSPLKGKTFYLHLQSAAKTRELENQLKQLGGMVEKFLSKELTCVITDQLATSRRTSSQGNETANAALPGPSRVQTRAQSILQRSIKQNKQPTKNTDVLANAKKWGLHVKPVNQVLNWIAAQENCTEASRAQSLHSTNRTRQLRGAFLKVEDHSRHYKPLIKDLISWPRINLDAPPGFSPFDAPVSMRTRSRCSSKSPGRRTKRKTNKQSSGSGFKRGYCELCYVNYAGIEKHIGSRMHRLIASNDETYAELDRLIGRGKSLEEFEADLRRKKAEEDDFNKRTRRSQTPNQSPITPRSNPKETINCQRVPTSSPSLCNEQTSRRISLRSYSSSSNRLSPRTVTPIKLIRSQSHRYSVDLSRTKKRRRDETNKNVNNIVSKRLKSDRYKIMESTPVRTRLRHKRQP